ncbi:MAG TPA: transcription termination/antitermination NusG family protein [Planctomycetota bacterium]|nr:transcription termination/antitermination NusG family protein [Planctomycetota bacterium]
MIKLSDNPPMLPPGATSLADLHGEWWVAHTKARVEKALAWNLLERRVGYFLPLVERVSFTGGRKRRSMLPLFSSYLFFCGTEEDRYTTMTTDRVCKVIKVADQPKLVAELGAIESALKSNARLEPYPCPAVGRRCRIISEPFKGLEGVVIRHCGKTRLVLQVSFIAQGAAMEVDAEQLEVID